MPLREQQLAPTVRSHMILHGHSRPRMVFTSHEERDLRPTKPEFRLTRTVQGNGRASAEAVECPPAEPQ